MSDLSDLSSEELDELDIEALLARVERKPLTFSRKQCLKQAPEFSQRLTGVDTVNEGQDTFLECTVLAFPRPDLTWYKDSDLILPDHPRMTVEEGADGKYYLRIKNTSKGDEAGYKCKAENCEGTTASTFFLFVNAKVKKSTKAKNKRRRVSYPPMFATIVEKVEEEERADKEARYAPPSPLSELYVGITLKSRHTWPKFLGEWAFAEDAIRSCSECTSLSDGGDDYLDGCLFDGADADVFHQTNDDQPISSILKTSAKQFFLGDVEDNEKIEISCGSFEKSNQRIGSQQNQGGITQADITPIPMNQRDITLNGQTVLRDITSASNNNNNFTTNKPVSKPTNLSLTNGLNSSVSAPDIAGKYHTGQMHVQNNSALTLRNLHENVTSDNLTTNRRHVRKKQRDATLSIHYRECVLVLIVFTFLALCFGLSCGRFIITVLGLHVIYAVSKSLLEK